MVDVNNVLKGATATTVGKKPCRAATTGSNIALLSGYTTIDGVSFQAADAAAGSNMRVLVKDQTAGSQNGIYLINSGLWTREVDFSSNNDVVKGTSVYVTDGAINGGFFFFVSSADPQQIGTNAITFTKFSITALDSLTAYATPIVSSATVNLDTATGDLVDISGTTTITAITLSSGRQRIVRFTGSLTLTNGASLLLPGGENIQTQNGDFAILRGYPAGIVEVVTYQPANGLPLTNGIVALASGATVDLGSVREQCIEITGGSTISSFGSSAPNGTIKFLKFDSNLTIINDNTAMILPGAINLQVQAGDRGIAKSGLGGNWALVSFTSMANPVGGIGLALGQVQGLTIKNNVANPNTQIDITFASAIAINSASAGLILAGTTVTCNLSANGANGLDTGALAATTTYYLYLISNGTTTASLASLSSTAPTMPAGYTYSVRVGAVLFDGSTHAFRTTQKGRDGQYVGASAYPNLIIGASVLVFKTLGGFIPPTATRVRGQWINASAGNCIGSVGPSSFLSTGSGGNIGSTAFTGILGIQNALFQANLPFEFMLESSGLWYISSGGTGDGVSITGWTDAVNAS